MSIRVVSEPVLSVKSKKPKAEPKSEYKADTSVCTKLLQQFKMHELSVQEANRKQMVQAREVEEKQQALIAQRNKDISEARAYMRKGHQKLAAIIDDVQERPTMAASMHAEMPQGNIAQEGTCQHGQPSKKKKQTKQEAKINKKEKERSDDAKMELHKLAKMSLNKAPPSSSTLTNASVLSGHKYKHVWQGRAQHGH